MARTSAQPSGYSILVVDDQAETLRSTRRLLEREGHRVLLSSDGHEALEIFRRERPQLLIIDYFMPGMTGEELIAQIRREDDAVQILLQTGYAGDKPAREMLESLDIQGYHDKSEGAERFLIWVGVCLKAHRQLQRVREAERLKAELLANLSHEFRTPLNISLGYVGMLIEGECGPLEPPAQEVLARVRCNTTSLLSLVNDLLDLSALETQAAEVRLEPIAIGSLRGDAIQLVEGLVGQKPVTLCWVVPDDLPQVRADRAKLHLILLQLLSCAVASTDTGEIRVHAMPIAGASIVLRVSYPSAGITAEQQRMLFEPLLQSHITSHDGNGGASGIGLAVARRLARGMGGDVSVETTPGVGSTFSVTLPLAIEASPASPPSAIAQ